MATEDEIREQLKHLDGVSKWLGKREIRALPSVLWPGERIENGVQGVYNARQGMLVATTSRLIFIEKSMLGRLTVEDFPYDKLTSIQYEVGWVFGKIRIFASGNRADIDQIVKDAVQPFAEMVRAKISAPAASSKLEVATARGTDLVAEIERLVALRSAGHLTEDEFQAAKARLLAA